MGVDSDLISRYHAIWEKISRAALRAGRNPKEIELISVSKRQPIKKMQDLLAAIETSKTHIVFGESYVQEFREKQELLEGDFSTHLIGALQRNKAKEAVRLFDVIESVSSTRLALALQREAEKISKLQKVCLQVNISEDQSKAGIAVDEVQDVLSQWQSSYPNLEMVGLMTITKFYEDSEEVRPDFRAMNQLREELRGSCGNLVLSMGMSADFEIAIEEGADWVRVGTALFGPRPA